MQEDCFLNPWDASIRALDLSHEVGTWSSGSTWIITEGVRKGQHRRVRFSNDVELYVGHEFDIEMTRCTSSLRTPSSHHQIFQPAIRLKSIDPSDEDEDASLLAVHAAHLRDIEHADITMDPTFAREPQEVNEQDELVDHDTDSESSYEQSTVERPPRRDLWRSTMIFAINREAVNRIVDWNDFHLMQNTIAAAVQVDTVDLLNFHHVETQPQDLRRANVEAVIAHRSHDVQPGDQRPLVLLDIEFHSNSLQHPPETVRKVHKIPSRISRQRLLEQLGLQALCKRSRNRCLLWVNDDLIPFMTKSIPLHDGDYVRVAVPPGGPRIDHIATRCLASAFCQGYTINEILERHTLYMLGWYDTVIGPPHVPLPFPHEEEDSNVLLQRAAVKSLPDLDTGPSPYAGWHVHGQVCPGAIRLRLEDDDEGAEQAPSRLSPWHQHLPGQDDALLERQPSIIQELFMTLVHFATVNPDFAEEDFAAHTWYLDGYRLLKCDAFREVALSRDFTQWMQRIFEVWNDLIDQSQTLNIFLVRPSPPLTSRQQRPAAHLILVQSLPLDGCANLFTTVTAQSEVIQFAKFAPPIMQKANVIISAEVHNECLPIVRDTQCMTWHGDFEIRERVAIRNRNGLSFLVIINGNREDQQSDEWSIWEAGQHDGDSLMQLNTKRTTIVLEALIPNTVAVQLIDGTEDRQLPTPLEVEAPGRPDQVEAELHHWGHDCQVFSCVYQPKLLCVHRGQRHGREAPGLHHYWFCHDDSEDPEGCFLHSTTQEMTEVHLMSFLCSLGYPPAVNPRGESAQCGLDTNCVSSSRTHHAREPEEDQAEKPLATKEQFRAHAAAHVCPH